MSIASGDAKWNSHSMVCDGQAPRLGQYQLASPGARTSAVPHDGQVVGNDEGNRIGRALLQHGRHDLGDDLAGAAHDHGVAFAHVLAVQLVLVVQRREGDRRATDEDRIQHRERRDLAGAAGVDRDARDARRALLGGKLVGDRPARRAAGRAQLVAQRELVDLHHGAVDLVRQIVAPLLPALAAGERLGQRRDHRDLVVDRQAGGAQIVERLAVPGGSDTAARRLRWRQCRSTRRAAGAQRSPPDLSGAGCRRRRCAGWRTAAVPRRRARG